MRPSYAATALAFDGSPIDGAAFTAITSFARDTRWLNGTVSAYSSYGVAVFAGLVMWSWWTARRAGSAAMTSALAVPVAAVLAYALNALVKVVVAEPRPCFAYPADFLLEACPAPSDYSFPSNHAVVVAAMAAALVLVSRRLGAVAAVAAAAMGFSRVYVGAHYPHDVLAGLILGATVGYVVSVAARRYAIPSVGRLRHTALQLLLGPGSGPTGASQA